MYAVNSRFANCSQVDKTSKTVNDIPREIIEKIVFLCDGVTIKRLSAVNKLFNEAVVKQHQFKSVWKKCVETEIDKDIVYELSRCNELSPQQLSRNENYLEDWHYKVYVKWYRSMNVGKWVSTDTGIDGFFQNPVTCIKLSGDLIIMGHRDGCVSICDHLSKTIQVSGRHIRMVTDIALVDLAGRDLYRIYESKEGAVSHHHHIISISKDQTIQVYPLLNSSRIDPYARITLKPSTYELTQVRVFGNICAVYSKSMKISLWRMALPHECLIVTEPLVFTHIAYVTVPEQIPGWFNLWETKVVSGVMFMCIGNGALEEFPIYKHFTSRVTSIALWGGIFAVGLESGEVAIYRCSSVYDLRTLRKPVYRRRLHPERGQEAIVALDISDNGRGPIVVASSKEAVSVLQWSPSY
ncbi:hypothetical protein B4U80_12846 [Leptotrombidium deliense]|uniref:F-box domain-containing protein n=1 Tax=Leptotrombidium deliense TaxID=299467 RepID=A0A443SJT6_9ACAR|nr:hypothetical protein B4U80_12846 [Leptotrombidium deliense]